MKPEEPTDDDLLMQELCAARDRLLEAIQSNRLVSVRVHLQHLAQKREIKAAYEQIAELKTRGVKEPTPQEVAGDDSKSV